MKNPKTHSSTRSQLLRLAPLLICATAQAAPVIVNEANSTNLWTLPTGTNLLNGMNVTDPAVPPNANHGNGDVTSSTWATLTDGSVGAAGNQLAAVAPPNGVSAIFPLNTSVNTNGYTITQFDSYCAWPDSGRDNQNFTIEYSTVSAPTTFLPLATVANAGTTGNATHTNITDSTGVLATGVHSIRINFASQENGYVGYREFILLGSAVPLANPLTWTGASGTGGNASWVTTSDNNWKLTTGGTTSPFSSLSPLTFDSTGANRTIAVPAALTAASITFANASDAAYAITGTNRITVSNDLKGTGAGTVTIANPLSLATGLSQSGSGTMTFNGAIESNGLTLTGTGGIVLNAANSFTGTASVANGTLKVANNAGLGDSSLSMTGGAVNFTTATPNLAGLVGSGGTITLGNTSPVTNTTLTVAGENATIFSGGIANATSATGSLKKAGSGLLTLSGTNTYTGTTTVSEGTLEFGKRVSLYNATPASWTAAKLVVNPSATLSFSVGGADEFTDADITAVSTGGFQNDSLIGFNTGGGNFTLTRALTGGIGLMKSGLNILTLSGTNTFTGTTTVVRGAINAANPSGISLPGEVHVGDTSFDATLNFGANNQFGANSVLKFTNGSGASNAKVQLRGTEQTVAGLEADGNQRLAIIQNDESNTPGFTTMTTTGATLTINATGDHSFRGLIRHGEATSGTLSIIKTGPGTQEFINSPVQSTSYTGPTFIDQGTLKLNYAGTFTGFNSNVVVAAGATFGLDGSFQFGKEIAGDGKVVKQGFGIVTMFNTASTYAGGTEVESGTLILSSGGATGEGTGPGDHCVAGLMDPSNVVRVAEGAVLQINGTAAFGNSYLQQEYAPSVVINEGAFLNGGVNTVTFVPNLTLNGGTVQITDGGNAGGFATNLSLTGTIIVGGSSTVPSVITTTGTGPYANASLGTPTYPTATFQVANVTASAATDLEVSSILQNAHGTPSALIKTGPGTMHVSAANTYTGATNVSAGTLIVDVPYFADDSAITIGATAVLSLPHGQQDTVGSLTIGTTQMAPGLYVATTNNAAGAIKTDRITGTGSLLVAGSTPTGYEAWALAIPDSFQRGRDADPDGDGMSNVKEYLFGTSPTSGTGSLSTATSTSSGLVVRWYQLSSGTSTYVLQESTDLVNWSASTATISNDPTQTNSGYTLKQATIPVSGARKFIRVQATE